MDGMGPHPTVYCIVPVDPLTVPGLRHLWYRYHVTLAPASSKAVTMVMGNSTKTVRSLIEHTGGGGLFMPSNSKRVIGTRYGSCPYEVECVGVELLPDRVKNDKGRGHKFTLQFEKSKFIMSLPLLEIYIFYLFLYIYIKHSVISLFELPLPFLPSPPPPPPPNLLLY